MANTSGLWQIVQAQAWLLWSTSLIQQEAVGPAQATLDRVISAQLRFVRTVDGGAPQERIEAFWRGVQAILN